MATNNVLKVPKGAAREYAAVSFNAYKRCSNGCTYCYLNRGVLGKALGTGTPELKKCFKNDDEAYYQFRKELIAGREKLIAAGGIFFSFVTDPCLPETQSLTLRCTNAAFAHGVPVTILTKMAMWIYKPEWVSMLESVDAKHLLMVGFTLTGHDEMEPNADSNQQRIWTMDALHQIGIKTFASIEPIIDCESSRFMVEQALPYCDHFKIGLRSGVKKDYYTDKELETFFNDVNTMLSEANKKVYWKDSFLERFGWFRKELNYFNPHHVDADYNPFKTSAT